MKPKCDVCGAVYAPNVVEGKVYCNDCADAASSTAQRIALNTRLTRAEAYKKVLEALATAFKESA